MGRPFDSTRYPAKWLSMENHLIWLMIANHPLEASSYARPMEKKVRRARLGENIKSRRIEAGHSMRRFAAMVGTSHTYLWEIETGRVSVGFDVLCAVADSLGVEVRDLIDF